MKNYLDDIFYWLGVLLITFGAYRIYPNSAFFVAGAFCFHFSFLIGKARANKENI